MRLSIKTFSLAVIFLSTSVALPRFEGIVGSNFSLGNITLLTSASAEDSNSNSSNSNSSNSNSSNSNSHNSNSSNSNSSNSNSSNSNSATTPTYSPKPSVKQY